MNTPVEGESACSEAKPVIGLIGGMGSGKSRVAAELQRHGGCIVSGDRLGHEALRQPAIRSQVVGRWGTEILGENGEVDRRQLGQRVFADPKELRTLEALVFPWIERRLQEEIAKAKAAPEVRLVVVDAAILLEAGWNGWCDRIVYIHAPRAERLRRLEEQRGWGAKEVEAREQVQMSLTDKVSRADAVVDNSGSPDHLAQQVTDLLGRWGICN
jgi:dephospho-CoA kinase